MSKILPVKFYDFIGILGAAQKLHYFKDEPIPDNYDINKVKSCLELPFQTVFGRYCYKGFIEKASILFYLFCKNHCLENGNKRMAVLILAYFCFINGKHLKMTSSELRELSTNVCKSDSLQMGETLIFIKKVITKSIKTK